MAQMSCVICLEGGATHVCECSLFHVHCFSNYLLRNGQQQDCSICYSRFDRAMLSAASSISFARTQDVFGPTHGTTLVRKLELASALANSGCLSEAKRLFEEIIGSFPEPPWLVTVSKVELARTLRDSGEIRAACDVLEGLVPCLARATAIWAQYEHVEACTLLGACYMSLGRLDQAERNLFFAMDNHLKNEHCQTKKVVQCMRHIANYYEARSDFALARETHRVALSIVEAEEYDPARIALANLHLANAEMQVGAVPLAATRFRGAILALRRRKHDGYALEALPDARRKLASLIRPSKRLRAKTCPEDC